MTIHQPLEGLRVLDLSQLLPGPFAAQMLGDLGADVIRVEPPGGDVARELPGHIFEVSNRNKRVLALDLKDDRQNRICLSLLESCDVVIEGFRPGVAQRLGLSYSDVVSHNPGIIYCSISGYGQFGPESQKSGHDLSYLAASGGLSVSGHWGEHPRRSGLPVSDLASSCYAVIAILSVLSSRRRDGTGTHLDVAIVDAALSFAATRGGLSAADGASAQDHLHPTNDLFATADGCVVAIAVIEQKFWEGLTAALSPLEPKLSRPEFASEASRRQHGSELHRLLTRVALRLTSTELLSLLRKWDVPVEPVVSVAVAAEERSQRGIVGAMAGEQHVLFPVLSDGQPIGTLKSVAPRLGDRAVEAQWLD